MHPLCTSFISNGLGWHIYFICRAVKILPPQKIQRKRLMLFLENKYIAGEIVNLGTKTRIERPNLFGMTFWCSKLQ